MNVDKCETQAILSRRVVTVWLFVMVLAGTFSYAQDERTRYFPNKRDAPKTLPEKENLWIFFMAGQSNMAGRGIVEPQDTVPYDRILTINVSNEIIIAKEPLHFYEPNLTGLDCGLSFARRLLQNAGKDVSILLIPVAVGGSSSHQWLGDSIHRNVKLMTNFSQRAEAAGKHGTFKGILWHQGESDTSDERIQGYEQRLKNIFTQLRTTCGNLSLPIFIGELGSYSENQAQWKALNEAIRRYAGTDENSFVIATGDLKPKADKIHFDAEGQRIMGQRMAVAFQKFSRKQK